MTDLNATVSVTNSPQLADDQAVAVAVAPRVTLEGYALREQLEAERRDV